MSMNNVNEKSTSLYVVNVEILQTPTWDDGVGDPRVVAAVTVGGGDGDDPRPGEGALEHDGRHDATGPERRVVVGVGHRHRHPSEPTALAVRGAHRQHVLRHALSAQPHNN